MQSQEWHLYNGHRSRNDKSYSINWDSPKDRQYQFQCTSQDTKENVLMSSSAENSCASTGNFSSIQKGILDMPLIKQEKNTEHYHDCPLASISAQSSLDKVMLQPTVSSDIKIEPEKHSLSNVSGNLMIEEFNFKPTVKTLNNSLQYCEISELNKKLQAKYSNAPEIQNSMEKPVLNNVNGNVTEEKFRLKPKVEASSDSLQHCSETSENLENKIAFSENKYNCTECGKSFLQKNILNRHLLIHKEKQYLCDKCNKSFTRSDSLKKHLVRHNSVKCDTCKTRFDTQDKLVEHRCTPNSQGTMRNSTSAGEERRYKCSECDKTFLRGYNLNRHLLTHKEKQYHCDKCGKSFARSDVLKKHLLLHSALKCGTCNVTFETNQELVEHRGTHEIQANPSNGEGHSFKCTHCDKTFSQKWHLKDHLVRHRKEKRHHCKICGKGFWINAEVKRHVKRVHTGERLYKCTHCDKAYAFIGGLNYHKKTHVQSFQCTACNKSFNTKQGLDKHQVTHSGEKSHLCNTCGMSFTFISGLRRHEKVHTGEKPHQCKICGKSFAVTGGLKRHMETHDRNRKMFQCNFCNKSLKTKETLQTHLLIHSNNMAYKCDICTKAFTTKQSLRNHSRLHNAFKSHQCAECDKTFHHKSALNQHMLQSHSENKPYQCGQCSKSFALKYQIDRHKLVHTGEKSHQCSLCGMLFSQKASLTRHYKNSHQNTH